MLKKFRFNLCFALRNIHWLAICAALEVRILYSLFRNIKNVPSVYAGWRYSIYAFAHAKALWQCVYITFEIELG